MKITPRATSPWPNALISDRGLIAIRVGNGYDLHRLVAGRPLVLGGVTIPFELGLAGHLDADSVPRGHRRRAGGGAIGDIGQHFPDTDPRWKGADSVKLLAHAVRSCGRPAGR